MSWFLFHVYGIHDVAAVLPCIPYTFICSEMSDCGDDGYIRANHADNEGEDGVCYDKTQIFGLDKSSVGMNKQKSKQGYRPKALKKQTRYEKMCCKSELQEVRLMTCECEKKCLDHMPAQMKETLRKAWVGFSKVEAKQAMFAHCMSMTHSVLAKKQTQVDTEMQFV